MDYTNDRGLNKTDLVSFTPDKVLSSHTRLRRRNLITGIFFSLSILYLGFSYPDLQIKSILFVQFDKPIDDPSPILFILAAYLAYFWVSFLFDFYSDLMQQTVGIRGIRPYKVNLGDESLEQGRDTFLLSELDAGIKCLIKTDKYQNIVEDKILNVNTSESFHVKDIYLGTVRTNFHDRVAVRQFSDNGKDKNYHAVEDKDLAKKDKELILKLKKDWVELVTKKYKAHVHSSFLWWFEIAAPVLLGLITFILLIGSGLIA